MEHGLVPWAADLLGLVWGLCSTLTQLSSLLHLPGVPDEEQLFKKPRKVVHKNTRFLRDPFSQALSRSQLQQAAALNAQVKLEGQQVHRVRGGWGQAWLLPLWLPP